MTLNLISAIVYTLVGVALLIGGIIVPLVYTVIPVARASGHMPMNLVWRLVLKMLFLLMIVKSIFLHIYVNTHNQMAPPVYYEPINILVALGLVIALVATWITHPDGIKSV